MIEATDDDYDEPGPIDHVSSPSPTERISHSNLSQLELHQAALTCSVNHQDPTHHLFETQTESPKDPLISILEVKKEQTRYLTYFSLCSSWGPL